MAKGQVLYGQRARAYAQRAALYIDGRVAVDGSPARPNFCWLWRMVHLFRVEDYAVFLHII